MSVVWTGIGIVALLVVVGLAAWRSTTPADDAKITATPEPTFIEQSNQFIQQQPDTTPVGIPDEEAETEASPTPATSPAPAAAQAEVVTVAMTDTGFTPETVTIAAGTTVQFVNNGQALHWPASDVHPTHQALPAFDAKQGVATGGTYSFTFTETGTWSCHDHLHPQFTCTIVVE